MHAVSHLPGQLPPVAVATVLPAPGEGKQEAVGDRDGHSEGASAQHGL